MAFVINGNKAKSKTTGKSFGSKNKVEVEDDTDTDTDDGEEDDTPVKKTSKKSGKNPFVKTGAAAAKAMEQAEAAREARRQRAGMEYRFRLPSGADSVITFLDGQIDEKTGILDIPYTNEHRIKVDNHYEDVVCIEDQEPCPLCQEGAPRSFVGLLTVIEHRPYTYEKDGKTIKKEWARRYMPCKNETLKQLTKLAQKRENGLQFSTYEVSRSGDKKAAVGDIFEYSQTHEEEDIIDEFGDEAQPLDPSENLTIYTAKEMAALGIGKKVTTFGKKTGIGKKGSSAEDIDDDDEPWN